MMDLATQPDFDEHTRLIDEYYGGETPLVLQDAFGVFWVREELFSYGDDGEVVGLGELQSKGTIPVALWPDKELTDRPPIAQLIQRVDSVWIVVCLHTVYATTTFEEDDWRIFHFSTKSECQYVRTARGDDFYCGRTTVALSQHTAPYFRDSIVEGQRELRFGVVRPVYGYNYDNGTECISFTIRIDEQQTLFELYEDISVGDASSSVAESEVVRLRAVFRYGHMTYPVYLKDRDTFLYAYIPLWGDADGYTNGLAPIQILVIEKGVPAIYEYPVVSQTEGSLVTGHANTGVTVINNSLAITDDEERLRIGVVYGFVESPATEGSARVIGWYIATHEVAISDILNGRQTNWLRTQTVRYYGEGSYGGQELLDMVGNGARFLEPTMDAEFSGVISTEEGESPPPAISVDASYNLSIGSVDIVSTNTIYDFKEYGFKLYLINEDEGYRCIYVHAQGQGYMVTTREDTWEAVTCIPDTFEIDFKKRIVAVGTSGLQNYYSLSLGQTYYKYIVEV